MAKSAPESRYCSSPPKSFSRRSTSCWWRKIQQLRPLFSLNLPVTPSHIPKTRPPFRHLFRATPPAPRSFAATFGCLADADGLAALFSAELTLPAQVSGEPPGGQRGVGRLGGGSKGKRKGESRWIESEQISIIRYIVYDCFNIKAVAWHGGEYLVYFGLDNPSRKPAMIWLSSFQ